GYTVKDFDVLVGAGPGSALSRLLPGVIGLALLAGLVQGMILRARAPEKHARIGLGNEADRKSTRLNSSHVKISYAVFCVEKKKSCDGRALGHSRQLAAGELAFKVVEQLVQQLHLSLVQ